MATELIDKDLEQQALTWPERARAIAIRDQRTYTLAGTLLVDISALEREIQQHHKPIKDAAFAAHKAAVAAEKRLLDPLQDAKGILKRGIGAWEEEQERIRQEAERKAQEAARKLEEEIRLQQAVAAEQAGADQATVEEIMETPIPIPVPIAPPTFDRVQGVSTSQRWRAEVFDIKLLCRAVTLKKLPVTYVKPNLTTLNTKTRAEKSTLKIPGVRAVPETTVAVRR
jgi:hypothetical protein